jgi:hypothetical protein
MTTSGSEEYIWVERQVSNRQRQHIAELLAEVEQLKAANEDALRRLEASADIARRNLMMRGLLNAAKRYRRARLHDDPIKYSYAERELDAAIAACEEKP